MGKHSKITAIALAILLFTPTVMQWALTPPGTQWVGYEITGTDYYTYLAKMTAGHQGNWRYSNLLTSEITEPVPIYLLYLTLGHISRLTGIDVAVMFHIARIICGLIAIFILVTHLKSEGWLAVYLAIAASGVGTSFVKGFLMPGHVYLNSLQNPHYMLTLAGMVMALKGFQYAEENRVKVAAMAGAVGTAMVALNLPFLMLLINLAVLLYGMLYARKPWMAIVYSAWTSLCALPIILPIGLAFLRVDWLIAWRSQAIATVDTPIGLILAFGISGLLALYQLPRVRGQRGIWSSWLIIALVLSCSGFFRNGVEYLIGLSVPIGVLAAPILKTLLEKLKWWLRPLVLAMASAEFIVLVAVFWISTLTPGEFIGRRYLPVEYVRTITSLREVAEPGDIVITQLEIGNMLPYLTGGHVRPYLGHQSETLNFRVKAATLQLYYEGRMTEEEKTALYRDSGAKWVITDYYLANKFAYVLPGQRPWIIPRENSTDLITVRRITP